MARDRGPLAEHRSADENDDGLKRSMTRDYGALAEHKSAEKQPVTRRLRG